MKKLILSLACLLGLSALSARADYAYDKASVGYIRELCRELSRIRSWKPTADEILRALQNLDDSDEWELGHDIFFYGRKAVARRQEDRKRTYFANAAIRLVECSVYAARYQEEAIDNDGRCYTRPAIRSAFDRFIQGLADCQK